MKFPPRTERHGQAVFRLKEMIQFVHRDFAILLNRVPFEYSVDLRSQAI